MMIRFLMVNDRKQISGLVTQQYYTLDIDVPDLERELVYGGMSEDTYNRCSLIGVEVVKLEDGE